MSVFMSYPSKRIARGPASRAKSNRPVGSLNLHDWCFRLAQRAPSLSGATEGSASEAADVRLESFGLSRGLSAAADGSTLLTALSLSKWSAFPEGPIASILRDASGGQHHAVLSPFLLHTRQHRDGGEDYRGKRHP